MLVIDDNMFRLAKMQETLLRLSGSNRQENLSNYKKIVSEIDTKAFADILEEIEHIDEHNQSLESELPFLEKIKSTYDQLLELQLSFKRVCELYGDNDLKLSDLSQLNIEYIENRISAINGYLVNIRNIDKNKAKLQELTEQLVSEEKKKVSLDNRLLEMETMLKNNFVAAEGRFIVDGKLQYASVVSEYNKLDFDFNVLLDDREFLEVKLSEYENKRVEMAESVQAAELCYNSILSVESKQVLNEIKREFLLVKYKLAMLKILKLISQTYVDYDEFVRKREQLLDLIKYRLTCMDGLGMEVSIDPFSRTKVHEQLETVLAISDNSKIISEIKKEISELNSRTEEMLSQNNNFLISLSDTKNLIENNVGFNDIDIEPIEFDFEEMLMKKVIEQNQVVSVRDISSKLNMHIVNQKTSSVIKRVNQMMESTLTRKNETKDILVPELVIVPKSMDISEPEVISEIEQQYVEDIEQKDISEKEPDLYVLPEVKIPDSLIVEPEEAMVVDTNSMFENVVPFTEPLLFVDRTEETTLETIDSVDTDANELHLNTNDSEEMSIELENNDDEMSEDFWVIQSENVDDGENEQGVSSFDDQINMLLAS